jgi:hypothetical protein
VNTQPMPAGRGNTLAPAGKTFKPERVSAGHWANGVMDEAWLFRDNLAFIRQVGLAS